MSFFTGFFRRKPKIVLYIFVMYRGRQWLFEKPLSTVDIVPFVGMEIVDLDEAGETYTVKRVEYHPRMHRLELLLKDDKWSDDYEPELMPDQDYAEAGWHLIDGPIPRFEEKSK